MNSLFYTLSLFGSLPQVPSPPPNLCPIVKFVDEWPPQYRVSEERVSASGQFSIKGYEKMIEDHPDKQMVVIDLRREFHGFVDGNPISWKLDNGYGYNEGWTADEIEAQESVFSTQVDRFETERSLVEKWGGRYVRFPITDHSFPQGEEVDRFVDLMKTLGPDTWVHIHCAGGSGRTTTLLAMIEIMKNNGSLTLDEILRRQEAIGGGNLYDPERQYADQPERIPGALQRFEFLQQFYQFCSENPLL